MKKFSEIVGEQKSDYIIESKANEDTIFDMLMKVPIPAQPSILVDDNQKLKRLANTFIPLINKKCGWNAYTFPSVKFIDGYESVVIVNKNKNGNAVSITPTSNGKSAALHYFLNFSASNEEQVAEYSISSQNIGTVKMFELLFDIVNNPEAYKAGVYEMEKKYGTPVYEAIEVKNEESFINEYNNVTTANNKPYAGLLSAKDGKLRDESVIGKWFTFDGFQNLLEFLQNMSKENYPPAGAGGKLAFEIFTKQGLGKEILQIISGANNVNSVQIRGAGALGLAKFVYDALKIDGYASITIGATVALSDAMEQQYAESYRGLDITFAKYLFGDKIDMFKQLVDEYFEDIEDLVFRIRKAVEYCKMPRVEKLKHINKGTQAIIISGIGGIGKSDAWRTVRKELKLEKNTDYAEKSSDSCSAKELYNFIYNNNGRYLVLDDTPNMFDSGFQASLWKKVLEAVDNFPEINAPIGQAYGENTRGNFYSIADCTEAGVVNCKKRYFKECPREAKNVKRDDSNDNDEELRTKIPFVPDTMLVQSRFLIITNSTEADLRKSLGKDGWDAIVSRSHFKRLAPPVEVVWARIKQKLLEVKATNDNSWYIPPECVDETIKIVEDEFSKFGCDRLTWRTFTSGDLRLDIEEGRNWQRTLRKSLSTQTDVNVELNSLRKEKRKSLYKI